MRVRQETKLATLAVILVLLVLVILAEVGTRILFALTLNDTDILFYPFSEKKLHIFTYNNFSPTGSLQPQIGEDGYLKYHPGSSKKIYVLDGDGELRPYFTRINNLGFRGPDVSAAKEIGVIRIVCLGESSTFGAYNRDETTWPMALEKELNESDRRSRYQVINMGVSESTTNSLVPIIYNEVLRVRPDLVLFYGGNNDASQYLFGQENQIKLKRSYSFFFEIVRAQYYRSFYHEMVAKPEIEQLVFSGASSVGRQVESNLRKAAEILKDNGIKFAVVLQPLAPDREIRAQFTGTSDYNEYLASTKNSGAFDFGMVNNIAYIHFQVMSTLATRFSPVLDGRNVLDGNLQHFVSHVHLNAAGNELLARFVANGVHQLMK